MGFTRAEFFRLLPLVFAGAMPPVTGDRITVAGGGRTVEIVLSEQRERVLSPVVRVPYLEVEIVLTGYGAEEAQRFLEHFDRQYQKAGG